MTQEWTRAEGMIIGDELDPNAVREELHERGVLAQLEWFASTPHMLSLTVATDGERIATVPAGSEQVEAGPALEGLAEDIAGLLADSGRCSRAEARVATAALVHALIASVVNWYEDGAASPWAEYGHRALDLVESRLGSI